MRTSTIVAAVAVAAAVGIYITAELRASGFECAACETDADCDEGLSCRPFDDGKKRCSGRELICREGHVKWPFWLHGPLVASIVVFVFAIGGRQLRDRMRDGDG